MSCGRAAGSRARLLLIATAIGAFPLGNKLRIALRELAQLLDVSLERLDVGIKPSLQTCCGG
jgi:hypothetical protein